MTEELFRENEYARQKLITAKNILRETYYRESSFDKLIETSNATPDQNEFQQLYFRTLIPKEWFTREDMVIDLVFQEFGSNLANSELKVTIEKIFNESTSPRVNLGENIREDLIDRIQTFCQNNNLDALLIPIDLYVDMHTTWLTEAPEEIQMDVRTGELSFCGVRPAIFWSNKLLPFDNIALIDKRFGRWVLKPSFTERLVVKITESHEVDKLDLLFYTTGRIEIDHPNGIFVINRPKPYLMI